MSKSYTDLVLGAELRAARTEIERLKSESDARLREIQNAWNERDAEKRLRQKAEADLAVASATIEFLNSNNLTLAAELAGWKQVAHQMEAERDQARAQVAAAYEAAAIRSENYARGAPYNQRASINALANSLRGMASDDARAALEAYGREKVWEGMQRAASLFKDANHGKHIMDAILAEMETLK